MIPNTNSYIARLVMGALATKLTEPLLVNNPTGADASSLRPNLRNAAFARGSISDVRLRQTQD